MAVQGCGPDCTVCELVNSTTGIVPSCVCEYPWANVADFAPNQDLDCGINFRASIAVSIVGAIIWLLSVLTSGLALLFARRALWSNTLKERLVMAELLAASLCASSYHILESSATFPGQYSIGTNFTVTVLWQLTVSICFIFLFSLPFVRSGTSVVPFAFQNSMPQLRKIVAPIAAVIFLLSEISTGFGYAVYFYPTRTRELMIGYFALTAIWCGSLCSCFVAITTKTINRMRTLLLSPELASSQRSKILLAYRSARHVRLISAVCLIVTFPPYLIFACYPPLVRHTYAINALNSYLLGLVVLRHSLLSLIMSRNVSARQSDGRTMSAHEAKPNKNNQDDDEEDDGRSDIARGRQGPLSSEAKTEPVSQSFSAGPRTQVVMKTLGRKVPRRFRKKRGIALMTRVTEEKTIDRTTQQNHEESDGSIVPFAPSFQPPMQSGDNSES